MQDLPLPINEDGMPVLQGIVERIVYQNEANGYTVCEMNVGEAEEITLVGTMPFLCAGETITVSGDWVLHPSFGRQFKVSYFEKSLPNTTTAIQKYLACGAIKGIGPKTAKALVAQFGEDTFDVIENHPDWFARLPGISQKRAEEISERFKEQHGMRRVMLFCRDFFGPSISVHIYHRFGMEAVERIQENPYILCEQMHSVSFEKADRIAQTLGYSKNNPMRVRAATKYLCDYNAFQNGHVYLPEEKVIAGVAQMLDITTDAVEDGVQGLLDSGQAVREKIGGRSCIFLRQYYDAEKYVTDKLDLLDRSCASLSDEDASLLIEKVEIRERITYAKLQRRAIAGAIKNGVMILTGGPGTGKTTVVMAILSIFEDMGYSIALAAPTGRAAKRLSEVTRHEAKTIHRLLEMEYNNEDDAVFNRCEKNPLDERIVIIDEASMIDLLLMDALLKAIRPGAKLILIGDADQLPPVGAGYVLRDLISSDRFTTIILTEIFRQAQQSTIVTNAHAINAGEYPDLRQRSSDFFYLYRDTEEQTAQTVAELCQKRLPRTYGAGVIQKIQVIAPSRKGACGTMRLNELLQSVLNPMHPEKREKKFRDRLFRVGDKVMQVRNNYDILWEKQCNGIRKEGSGIFNGDIGIIEQIDPVQETMQINFDERITTYDFSLIDELELAYAITVHKSQGSEYPVVILPIYRFSPRLMTRNLLYTAVTRASEMVILVGDEQQVHAMVDNNRQSKRYSALAQRLQTYEKT